MAKSYAQLKDELAALQARTEAARLKERDGVIGQIKQAIEVYGLTAQDLAIDGPAPQAAAPGKTVKRRARKARRSFNSYADGNGNVWGGAGPRPGWLRDALASGRQLSDFLVKA